MTNRDLKWNNFKDEKEKFDEDMMDYMIGLVNND